MKAILIRANGAPAEMRLEEVPVPVAGPSQALIRVNAAGVNFMDTGVVSGALQLEPLPLIPGVEGSGTVLALGKDTADLKIGDRVAWLFAPHSYAEQIAIDASALVPVPASVDDAAASGLLMQGITASHFTSESYAIPARPGCSGAFRPSGPSHDREAPSPARRRRQAFARLIADQRRTFTERDTR